MAVCQNHQGGPGCSGCSCFWQLIVWAALHQMPQRATATPVHDHVQAVHILIHSAQGNNMRVTHHCLHPTNTDASSTTICLYGEHSLMLGSA